MKDFTDKVAAITGAGSGIGRALAHGLARRGCHLALSDIDEAALTETAAQLEPAQVRITTDRLDVADRTAVHAWADQVATAHGRVNLIFNNAGVSISSTVEAVDYADLEWILSINLWGVIHGTKAFLPHLKASGDGHVVNTSSILGIAGQTGLSAYCASKFAVRGFTESLRQELEFADAPVSATSVHPGGIQTGIARAGRVDPSIEALTGKPADQSRLDFEKSFINTPDKAAADILRAVLRNRPRVLIGGDARVLDWVVRHFPSAYRHLMLWQTRQRLAK